MANPEHLAVLKQGVETWNEWRQANSDIKEPDLVLANLREVNLSGAKLSGALLSRAKLSGALLSRAKLSGADLRGANLNRADLREANLNKANLREANLNKVDLHEANLEGADLREANLNKADLSGADLRGVNLNKADLSEANLSEANLIGANLIGANLIGANLSGADLRGVFLPTANLRGANLVRTNLERANLEGADLRRADFERANLEGADLRRANLEGASLEGADLHGVNLRGALLYRADLREANLHEADLGNAMLSETVFGNTHLAQTKGLDTCEHKGPSTLDHHTLQQSGPLSPVFLRSCRSLDTSIDYRSHDERLKAVLHLLLVLHWALPAGTALAAGLLFGTHPLLILAVMAACVLLRPIHTGPLLRSTIIIIVYIHLYLPPGFRLYKSADTFLPSWLFYALFIWIIPMVFIELENQSRQASRDRAAESIMTRARNRAGAPVPRFSLYLRPFQTSGRLASNDVGSGGRKMIERGEPGSNVQTDFEAILASAFPAYRPLIALGAPRELLPTRPEGIWSLHYAWRIPGTGKVESTETNWREDFMLLARYAETIVIVPLNFAGTIWEIRWLYSNGMLPKCVFVMPATKRRAHNYAKMWLEASQFLTSIGIDPPEYQPGGGLFLINEGTLRSLPSFAHNTLMPRATALLIQFALLRRKFKDQCKRECI